MFSGLVKGVGRVAARTDLGKDQRFTIEVGTAGLPPLVVGASIAVNGVCLTVVTAAGDRFTADVSAETLAVTTLGNLRPGSRVNLESPLRAGDPLDGHIVSGHVDGVGHVVAVEPVGVSLKVTIEVPPALARYVAMKGSVAVDGVSLTVNAVHGPRFEVNIIPHTQAMTVIGEYRAGTAVNIEVDLLARYLERLLQERGDASIDLTFLRHHGYARND
ncbi:MAG TPA: riboflavin synthase [Gammaproteobacteria bacterium]|nr:riboflavin synthase [Gammaproteobacteria bacterium]